MYNDERNLYHYTYRKDGSETAPPPADNYQPIQGPVQEMKPVRKNRIGLKCLLDLHHDLINIQGVRPEILRKSRLFCNLIRVHAQYIRDRFF